MADCPNFKFLVRRSQEGPHPGIVHARPVVMLSRIDALAGGCQSQMMDDQDHKTGCRFSSGPLVCQKLLQPHADGGYAALGHTFHGVESVRRLHTRRKITTKSYPLKPFKASSSVRCRQAVVKNFKIGWLTPSLLVITPATCRAARALLGIKQIELATGASISLSAVKGFESGANASLRRIRRASQSYLEAAGIEFIVEDDLAVGVRQRIAHDGCGPYLNPI
jgi:hypothetical protein